MSAVAAEVVLQAIEKGVGGTSSHDISHSTGVGNWTAFGGTKRYFEAVILYSATAGFQKNQCDTNRQAVGKSSILPKNIMY